MRKTIEIVMTAVLLVMAGLFFRDTVRFQRSGKAGDVTQQLPDSIKKLSHAIMKRRMG